MRILHIVGKLDRGGVETWLLQVLRHIDRKKYQMDFMVHTTEPGAYDDEVRELGARVIPCLRPSSPARYAWSFGHILRQYGPYDVVHSHVHHFSGYVLTLAAFNKVGVRISHSHTSAPKPEASLVRQMYLGAMEHLIRQYATLGIAISTLAADSLMPGWEADAAWCLRPYGIDTANFDAAVDAFSVRSELGLPANALVVGHVGRFVDVKNHAFIVDIASEMVQRHPHIIFLLVGDGPLRRDLEADIAKRGLAANFVLTGLRDDIPRLMKGGMDAFLFPSRYEGLGIVLMEAQLAGLCSVVSDVIPLEADLSDGAVTRLPLSASAGHWAESLLTILEAKLHCNVSPEVQHLRSISRSVADLTDLYDAQCWIPSRKAVRTRGNLLSIDR